MVKGTKKVVNKVVDAVNPIGRSPRRRHPVGREDRYADEPGTGKTAFVVKNVGNEKHNFVVRGKDGTHKFMVDLQPNETKVLHVQLKRGTYSAYSPLDGHPKKARKRR